VLNPFKLWMDFWSKTEEPEFTYSGFRVQNFRGIEDVSISLKRSNLALLLGLNESGKTSLLKAIESFDYRNDPPTKEINAFFKGMRNKKDVDSNKTVRLTAQLAVKRSGDPAKLRKRALEKAGFHDKEAIASFFETILERGSVTIDRCVEFSDGVYKRDYYEFVGGPPEANEDLAKIFVSVCPFIIYFEDFKDRIPEKIYISDTNEAYDSGWSDIIDGLFHHTNGAYSVSQLQKFHSESRNSIDDASTVLQRVNKTLNKVFTEKWKQLSGVRDIDQARLTYSHSVHRKGRYFQVKVVDSDGTTYSVDERSKGALWYLSFLMKTEFRRKKLRGDSGKPIFLIDEPASNLHSSAQRNMIEDFSKLVEDTSVIYTTHSQYLISLSNISNTYIIDRNDGKTTCVPWGEYIKGVSINATIYQPLADVLQIVPSNFDIPWEKCVLTEGPSDMNVLWVMASGFGSGKFPQVAIYPGSSASNLGPLISLNLGWSADFRILLDGDDEGRKAKVSYMEDYAISEDIFVMLPDGKRIEDIFSAAELTRLSGLVGLDFNGGGVNKKQFAALFAVLREKRSLHVEAIGLLDPSTKEWFKRVLSELKLIEN
jgi:AAA15 family ATPase/GTPase